MLENEAWSFCCCSSFSTSLSLAEYFGHLTWVRHSSRKSNATHSYQCVSYFRVQSVVYGCQCLKFSACAQLLMHAIAHGGLCGHRKRVCSGSWLWEINPLPHRGFEPEPVFNRTLCQLSYPAPAQIHKCSLSRVLFNYFYILFQWSRWRWVSKLSPPLGVFSGTGRGSKKKKKKRKEKKE